MLYALLLICFVILPLVIYLLFAPVLLEIDTRNRLYKLRFYPVFSMQWVTDGFFGYPEMNLLGFRKKLKMPVAGKEKKNREKTVKNKSEPSFKFTFRKLNAILSSFKVKKWLVNIDTGDMALNGRLFPVLYGAQLVFDKKCSINFYGVNEVTISIENNVFGILKALIK